MRMIFVTVIACISKVLFQKLLDISCFKSYEAHWQQHLKDTLQLKILRTWIDIHVNFFLGKYHEVKMGEGALEIISCTKIWACSLKDFAPRHFTYYCIFQSRVVQIIFIAICLLFYLLMLCVSWYSSSASKSFKEEPLNFWWS